MVTVGANSPAIKTSSPTTASSMVNAAGETIMAAAGKLGTMLKIQSKTDTDNGVEARIGRTLATTVPASSVTTAPNPSTAINQQMQMQQEYQTKSMMANMLGQAVGGLGSMFAGLGKNKAGDDDSPKNRRQERLEAKAEWKNKGANN